MKKNLVCLVLLFCLLSAFSFAHADQSSEACTECGNTDLSWYSVNMDGSDAHIRFCSVCQTFMGGYMPCTPEEGSATCSTPPLCQICRIPMSVSMEPDFDNHQLTEVEYWWNFQGYDQDSFPIYRASARQSCTRCRFSRETSTIATCAITTPPTCTEHGTVTFTAVFEEAWAGSTSNDTLFQLPSTGHTVEIDRGVPATCTQTGLTDGAHCAVCKKILVPQEVIYAGGHNYQVITTQPTCTEDGYVQVICMECGHNYVHETLPATLHWFNPWTPNGDSTHTASCQRCDFAADVECTGLEATLADGVTLFTVCPICGEAGEKLFEIIEDANMVSATDTDLPTGEAVIRGMKAPFDDVLYAFTAAYEYSGRSVPFGTAVTVSLPLSDGEYPAFTLVRVDITPAGEDTPRTETRTAVPFTFENDILTFEAEEAALYLIIAQ